MPKQIGLFFGSFNPVHIGHLILANYFVENTTLNEVWFVVSPQNPHKEKSSLLPAVHRYAILSRAIEEDPRFKVSKVEFNMPVPSYTCDTLVRLEEQYPEHEFALIMGEDNLKGLHKWKNFEHIVESYNIYVYPREGKSLDEMSLTFDTSKITLSKAPKMEISASMIRAWIKEGKEVQYLLPAGAWKYIDEMNFYR